MTNTDHKKAVLWTIICFLILVIFFVLFSFLSGQPNIRFASSAIALSMMGAIAVGIERVIEAFWSFMGVVGKQMWPLSSVAEASTKLVAGLDDQLKPFSQDLDKAITLASQTGAALPNDLAQAKVLVDQFKNNLQDLQATALFDPDMEKKAAVALKQITTLQGMYPTLQEKANLSQQSILAAVDFVATFNDNPGKRLVSIYAGMLLGVVVAGITGLDLFQAVLGATTPVVLTTGAHWGVGLTGIVVGLGASPTHEVIQILKSFKENQQNKNA